MGRKEEVEVESLECASKGFGRQQRSSCRWGRTAKAWTHFRQGSRNQQPSESHGFATSAWTQDWFSCAPTGDVARVLRTRWWAFLSGLESYNMSDIVLIALLHD